MDVFASWKTTLAGAIVIGLGALHTFFGVDIPGVTADFYTALPIGAGLIFAKDYNVTHNL
jgi:hypothetical protein